MNMLLNNKNMSIFRVCMKTAGFDQTMFHMLKHYLALRSMASATAIQTAWRRYICASNWPLYKQKLDIQDMQRQVAVLEKKMREMRERKMREMRERRRAGMRLEFHGQWQEPVPLFHSMSSRFV